MKIFAKFAVVGLIGMIMLTGNGVKGIDEIDVTIIKPATTILLDGTKTTLVKTKGKCNGTHTTQPEDATTSGCMAGPEKGSVSAKNDKTFSATAGANPSKKINDTRVIIKYLKNELNIAEGSADLTVVGVLMKSFVTYRDKGHMLAIIHIVGKGMPSGLGGTTCNISKITETCMPMPPFASTHPGNVFHYMSPLLKATSTFAGAMYIYDIGYGGFNYSFKGKM